MTMPHERTRSLRWGFEFLGEMLSDETIDDHTRATAQRLLLSYPRPEQILELIEADAPGLPRTATEANQFASVFLMPEVDVRARLPRVGTLGEIVVAKKRWRVSVAALNYRLHKLGITTDWQYRTFCIQIMQNYKQAEPEGIDRELSVVWDKVLTQLREEGITPSKLADKLGLPVFEVENLLFRLTNMQHIKGGGAGGSKSRARLSVV